MSKTKNIKLKISNLLRKHYKLFTLILVLFIGSIYIYGGVSKEPIKNAFNKAFKYYLTGDCEKFSESFNVSFSKEFLDKYGDTDWLGDAQYQKLSGIVDKCKENRNIFEVKIRNISRESFSDTAFVQIEYTEVNDNGVHHKYPGDLIMKKFGDKWFIDVYCDTKNDAECK